MIHDESHTGMPPTIHAMRSSAASLALLAIFGFVAGVFLVIVTDAVEKAGLEGSGWSLRGNGALVVLVCGLPGILIVALALLARGLQADRRSCLAGPGAGFSALFLAWLLSFVVSWVLLPLALVVAFLIALLLARGAGQRRTVGWLMGGTLVLPVAILAGIWVAVSRVLGR